MQTKLHINLTQGIIDVEGDVELVKAIYEDFKERLATHVTAANVLREPLEESSGDDSVKAALKPKRQSSPRRKGKSALNGDSTINPDAPKLDKSLDTSGLATFYNQFEPKNNSEKILIFLKFLSDTLGIENPNTDQVYTCYEAANERIPKAFSQAFRDASGKKFGFIDYNAPTDIPITTLGSNYFKFDLKKKGAE